MVPVTGFGSPADFGISARHFGTRPPLEVRGVDIEVNCCSGVPSDDGTGSFRDADGAVGSGQDTRKDELDRAVSPCLSVPVRDDPLLVLAQEGAPRFDPLGVGPWDRTQSQEPPPVSSRAFRTSPRVESWNGSSRLSPSGMVPLSTHTARELGSSLMAFIAVRACA